MEVSMARIPVLTGESAKRLLELLDKPSTINREYMAELDEEAKRLGIIFDDGLDD